MKRRTAGIVVAIAVAVAVALQWLPGREQPSRTVQTASPTQITLSIRSEGLAVRVERSGVAVTVRF
jgi:hypothetical protein